MLPFTTSRPPASLSLALALGLLLACTACTTQPTPPPQTSAEQAAPLRPLPADTLYSLLVAEFAAYRNQPDITLQHYLEQARATHDAGIAKRATLIAQFLGKTDETEASARLWGSLAPGAEPDAILAAALMNQGKFDEAFDVSLRLRERGFNPAFQGLAAQAVNGAIKLDEATAQAMLNKLLLHFEQGLSRHPDDAQLLTGDALLLQTLGRDDEALRIAEQAIKSDPDNNPVYLLKAALIEKRDGAKAAAEVLSRRLKKAPDDIRLQLQYGRLLTQLDLPAAREIFADLHNRAPLDADILFSLALINKQLKHWSAAQENFEQLLYLQKYTSAAWFHLGNISEQQQENARALEQYQRATEEPDWSFAVGAYCRLQTRLGHLEECRHYLKQQRDSHPAAATRLYVLEADMIQGNGNTSDALALLNHALQQSPNDPDLLYSRSMVFDAMNNLPAAEQDLRVVLKQHPDNSAALNALGYMLANKTDRYPEAQDLITRALKIEPENAAILDSMGWVLYRQKQLKEALPYLRKALKLFPNHEVAAHLGEVLWVMGKQDDARAAWKVGIDDNPDSPVIKETLQRLQAK